MLALYQQNNQKTNQKRTIPHPPETQRRNFVPRLVQPMAGYFVEPRRSVSPIPSDRHHRHDAYGPLFRHNGRVFPGAEAVPRPDFGRVVGFVELPGTRDQGVD